MILLQPNELSDHIRSIIHQDTQQHSNHFDLSVAEIHELSEAGSLDFGGNEFKSAGRRPVILQKNQDDDYGWWQLSRGTYQATMNEKIEEFEDTIALLGPHSHARKAGIIANTCILSSEDEGEAITINFGVPEAGCNIKENARFAVVYLLAN